MDVLRLESFFHGTLSVNLEYAYKCPLCPSRNVLLTAKEKQRHLKLHEPPAKPPRPPPPITRQQVKNIKKANKEAGKEEESSSSNESEDEDNVLYQCRLCPAGRLFTARERDYHRDFHRRQRAQRRNQRHMLRR